MKPLVWLNLCYQGLYSRFQDGTIPRKLERIYIEPSTYLRCPEIRLGRESTGQFLKGDWDVNTFSIMEHSKVSACLKHWVDGVSWKETGIIDQMIWWIREVGPSYMHGSTYQDVVERYESLDRIFDEVSKDRNLKSMATKPLFSPYLIEPDGCLFHIDRHNNPLFGGSGCHRLGMSIALNLPQIPAAVGVVHDSVRQTWRQKFCNPNPSDDLRLNFKKA